MKLKEFLQTKSNQSTLKLIRTAILLGLTAAVLINLCTAEHMCDQIKSNVVRLHILANSDSEADQALKIKVRDRLISEGRLYLGDCADREAAADEIASRLESIKKSASDEIAAAGYDYPVEVGLEDSFFGTRVYDSVTLPAGEYQALRVVIGSGRGHNWWCVMFPPMCVSAAGDVSADPERLEQSLDNDESDFIENGKKYQVKFKTVEYYETLKNLIKKSF